jgi:acylglycerol lipase
VKQTEETFAGAGGTTIFWRAWFPHGEPRAAVVIVHGVSEHSGRYAHVGARLAASGYAAYALDHRGHGRSEGDRAYIDRLGHATADLRTVVGIARERHPGRRAFMLGHSLGGAIALAYTLEHDSLDGLALSGPAVSLETAGTATRFAARVLSAVTPKLGIFAVDASAISRDPAVVAAYESDPLVYRGKVPARTLAEVTQLIAGLPRALPALHTPLLLMHGDGDSLVPVSASRMVHDTAGSADKTLKVYPGLYHEILNEPEQAQVLDELVAWLEHRIDRP